MDKINLKYFGIISDDFSPSLKHMGKRYITGCEIFLLEGHGFYATAMMSYCEKSGGMFEVKHEIYPIKIDVENKQFLIIGNGNIADKITEIIAKDMMGEAVRKTVGECMKVENIDKMVDNVIAAICGEPLDELIFQRAEENDDNSADWWKGDNKDDGESWKKGYEDER